MAGWHRRYNGHELGQTPGDGEGQGGLVWCVHGVIKSQTWLGDWTATLLIKNIVLVSDIQQNDSVINYFCCCCPVTQVHVHCFGDAIQPSHHLMPLLLLPSIFSSISDSSCELTVRLRWPKYWSFSFNISPSNEYSGLISLNIDWFDPLAVQRTLRSLLQFEGISSLSLYLLYYFLLFIILPSKITVGS